MIRKNDEDIKRQNIVFPVNHIIAKEGHSIQEGFSFAPLNKVSLFCKTENVESAER